MATGITKRNTLNEHDLGLYMDTSAFVTVALFVAVMQTARARWRCNLCHMRRELVAASGVWYHGGLAQPVISSATFREKLSTDSPHPSGSATCRMRVNSDNDYLLYTVGGSHLHSPRRNNIRYRVYPATGVTKKNIFCKLLTLPT